MRITDITLSWFRGAADMATLSSDSKSLVIYGENGSGKSSFVDAVEHVLNEGKITHLAHEYSGKRQEKGIVNTHTPKGKNSEFRIKFRDGTELRTKIAPNGAFLREGPNTDNIGAWDCQRTILRQDEVARFIYATKGDKYSALLPLLGLQHLELTAENTRQIFKTVDQKVGLKIKRERLKEVAIKRKSVFGDASDEDILKIIEEYHNGYCQEKRETKDPMSRCKEVLEAISNLITGFAAEQRRHLVLQDIAGQDLKGNINALQTASLNLASVVEPLIEEKLKVLQSADSFVDKLTAEDKIRCPACGSEISPEDFRDHVKGEKERLQEILNLFEIRKAAISVLCDTLTALKTLVAKVEAKTWHDKLINKDFADNFAYLEGLDIKSLRNTFTENDRASIEAKVIPIIDTAIQDAKHAPKAVHELSKTKQDIETAMAILNASTEQAALSRAEALLSYLNFLENRTREEIRTQSQHVIDDITADIQEMWAILHPGEAIEDVRLYLHEEADKAIDIGLKFYGVPLDSPRLTLSEGNRNSLGLCIFMAMAKRAVGKDNPLFLDDIVVSLDRNHRSKIAELLEKEFAERQVFIFTHQRDWFVELRQQLDHARWNFKVLMPWEKPEIGIQWSEKNWSFDDARAKLATEPDTAGNIARKIMDTELALRSAGVKLRLPYLHREKNDHRVAHDFLLQLISDGERCFQIKEGDAYKPHTEAIEAFRKADTLLISWGNKASHDFDVVPAEAEALIDSCEKALEFTVCPDCNKAVHRLDDTGSEHVQCQCGKIRWRYGKG